MSITVVIPSRSRPARANEAIQALRRSAVRVDTTIVLAVDRDDPELPAYSALRYDNPGPEVTLVALSSDETGNLVKATNTVSLRIAEADPDTIIGNLGDDHMVRTFGWDRRIAEVLETPGIAYGDDLLQGEVLPTAPFVSAVIVNALGYYFLPDLDHMYVDNAMRDIAEQAGVRRYLPDVVIEHMHPSAGKVEWDDAYLRVNAETPVRLDRLRYESWREHAMPTDIERVRQALQVTA